LLEAVLESSREWLMCEAKEYMTGRLNHMSDMEAKKVESASLSFEPMRSRTEIKASGGPSSYAFGIRLGFTIPIHDERGPIAALTFPSDHRNVPFETRIAGQSRVLQLMLCTFMRARSPQIEERARSYAPAFRS
jgi:hypothetical protein